MQNLKADSVLFLTRDDSTEIDRSAAKLFARCEVECRHVGPAHADRPAVDVLVHGHPDTIGQIKSSECAGRLENAMRRASDAPIRHLQWVEEGITAGPRNAAGIGDGRDAHPEGGDKNPGDPPRFDHNGPRAV
jgi:hypothetical protein